MLGVRDQEIVLERERGTTVVELGERYGISNQRVSQIAKTATEFVNKVELDLMVASKTGEVCAYLVPFGPDYTLAMMFGGWLIRRLRDRGLELRVETRQASNGLALLIDNATSEEDREA
jgi:hypothetical protein